jgi:hypothetical protein
MVLLLLVKSGRYTGESRTAMESSMRLTSSAFADGAMIPRHFTCDQDLSPPLAWTDVPNNVLSFVLLCDEPACARRGVKYIVQSPVRESRECPASLAMRALTEATPAKAGGGKDHFRGGFRFGLTFSLVG